MALSQLSQTELPEDVQSWIRRAQDGSSEALGALLEYCRNYLLLVANQELEPALRSKGGASDVVQETFLDAQINFEQFRGRSEAEVLAWLRRILLNNLSNIKRSHCTQKRAYFLEVPLNGDSSISNRSFVPAAKTLSPSGENISWEEVKALEQAMQRLPDRYRISIELRNWQRRSFAEIGETMSCSADAARKLWSRAIERLRHELSENEACL